MRSSPWSGRGTPTWARSAAPGSWSSRSVRRRAWPVATSAYPVLAAAAGTADTGRYRSTLAGAARGVVLLSCLGAAALVGVAAPAGRILGVVAGGNVAGPIAAAVAGFAPGLIG